MLSKKVGTSRHKASALDNCSIGYVSVPTHTAPCKCEAIALFPYLRSASALAAAAAASACCCARSALLLRLSLLLLRLPLESLLLLLVLLALLLLPRCGLPLLLLLLRRELLLLLLLLLRWLLFLARFESRLSSTTGVAAVQAQLTAVHTLYLLHVRTSLVAHPAATLKQRYRECRY